MGVFVTSDCHFGHTNILTFEIETRPFSTVEEMNEKLIENWNGVVKSDDTVYVLGDMFMGSLDLIDEIMPRLNGKKILIRGNHDTKKRIERYAPYFESIHDIYHLKVGKQMYALCHYPMREWFAKDHGAIHLYGHVHSNDHRGGVSIEPNSFHVGVDTNNLTPIKLEDIKNKFVEVL